MEELDAALREIERVLKIGQFEAAMRADDRIRRIEAFANRLLPGDIEAQSILVLALMRRAGPDGP